MGFVAVWLIGVVVLVPAAIIGQFRKRRRLRTATTDAEREAIRRSWPARRRASEGPGGKVAAVLGILLVLWLMRKA